MGLRILRYCTTAETKERYSLHIS